MFPEIFDQSNSQSTSVKHHDTGELEAREKES